MEKKKKSVTEHYDDDSIILRTGVLVFDLMLLNVMWFICSLPVVTIGVSTTALNYTCLKINRDEGDSLIGMFFHSLKQNFKQALFLGTGMVALLIVLFAALIQALGYANAGHTLGIFLSIACVLLLFGWLLMFVYLFMVLARFDNTFFRTIVNSVYIAFKNPDASLKVFMITTAFLILIPVIFWSYIPYLFPMFIFFGVPVTAYLNARIFNKTFDKYIK